MESSICQCNHPCIDGAINGPMESSVDQWNHKGINGVVNRLMEKSRGRGNHQWIDEIIKGLMESSMYQSYIWNPIIVLYCSRLKNHQKLRSIEAMRMG